MNPVLNYLFIFCFVLIGLHETRDDITQDKIKGVKVLEDSSESELEEGELKVNKNETSEKHKIEHPSDSGDSKKGVSSESLNHSLKAEEKENKTTTESKQIQQEEEQNVLKVEKKDALLHVEESDDYLMYLEEILKKIHKLFYKLYDENLRTEADLKKVIPAVRQQVLAGTKLVFSGMVPTHMTLEQSKAFCIAQSLGAEVTQDFTKDTTHLIAVRAGTAKVSLQYYVYSVVDTLLRA